MSVTEGHSDNSLFHTVIYLGWRVPHDQFDIGLGDNDEVGTSFLRCFSCTWSYEFADNSLDAHSLLLEFDSVLFSFLISDNQNISSSIPHIGKLYNSFPFSVFPLPKACKSIKSPFDQNILYSFWISLCLYALPLTSFQYFIIIWWYSKLYMYMLFSVVKCAFIGSGYKPEYCKSC